jgi:hypothetical protein
MNLMPDSNETQSKHVVWQLVSGYAKGLASNRDNLIAKHWPKGRCVMRITKLTDFNSASDIACRDTELPAVCRTIIRE